MRSRTPFVTCLVVALGLVALSSGAACSSGSSGSSGSVVLACRQKSGSDTDSDCTGQLGKPRKLDCDNDQQTQQAVNAGCTPTKPGDSDVCCPTTIAGTVPGTSSGGTVACTQKAGSDTDKDCAAALGKPRKLDCDASQTQQAVAAGCTQTNPGGSDVCCPLTVNGTPETTTTPTGTCTTSYAGSWSLAGTCQEPTCTVAQSGCSVQVSCTNGTSLSGTLSGSTASLSGTSRGQSLTCTASFTSASAFSLSCNLCNGSGTKK
jgi:hypothetical protein